jgi:hypothetical protein
MILTLNDFLAYFPPLNITREQFIQQFHVTYVGHPSLFDLFNFKCPKVIKNQNDPRWIQQEAIIDYFYDVIIVNREKYLSEFYNSYLKFPNPYGMKWDNVEISTQLGTGRSHGTPDLIPDNIWVDYLSNSDTLGSVTVPILGSATVPTSAGLIRNELDKIIDAPDLPGISVQKNDPSRRIIRNLNYLDILHTTQITNSVKSKVSFWQSLINVYNHLTLEDRFFAPSSIGLFLRTKPSGGTNYNNFFYLFQQYQPKASIFNPYSINYILKNILVGKKLLTPVLSWNSYLVAFMHSDWEHYVGIDVIPRVCQSSKFIFDYYRNVLSKGGDFNAEDIQRLQEKKLDIYCQPSESLLYDPQFLAKYGNYFDAVLMCPPYYRFELYQGGQQSTDTYETYMDWIEGYWLQTVALSDCCLRRGGQFAMIVNNYSDLNGTEYQLIQDLSLVVLKYFKLVNVIQLLNRVSPLRVNKKNRTEMMLIFEKP